MTEIHKNLKTIGISTRNALEQKQAIEIIEKIFKEKIIGKIKYNQEYDEIINNNFKTSKENVKNLIKEFQVLNI